jgi:hypothetical protein
MLTDLSRGCCGHVGWTSRPSDAVETYSTCLSLKNEVCSVWVRPGAGVAHVCLRGNVEPAGKTANCGEQTHEELGTATYGIVMCRQSVG